MCGICGYVGVKKISPEQLWNMNNTMRHRGPDDGGIWERQEEDFALGLAQRRLSILDLSELGHQPMISKDGRYVIAYNGEVYNYKKLREELVKLGYHFASDCDTEVILYAFSAWGKECFSKFNGMFAIAVYDISEKKLTLARDRMGKKPLHYYSKGHDFVFGSELKALMQYPYFEKKINRDMIEYYLCNKYIVSPLCIFENTYKLEPGTYLEYQNGNISITRYWDIVDAYNENIVKQEPDFQTCKRNVNRILEDAVMSRLVADVPVGTFLSGGIDSTLVTAIAQKNADHPVNTYSIGFCDKEDNEAEFSAEIAKYIGTNHHEHYVTENDVFELIKDLTYYYDEPFSDSSELPTMLVSQYASKDITVALSGDGGDEIFCGYGMYDKIWVSQHFDWCAGLCHYLPGMKKLESKLPSDIKAILQNRDKSRKVQLNVDMKKAEADKLIRGKYNNIKYSQEDRLDMDKWQVRRMLLDMQTYLPDDILAKTDRASMKYSLEVRCPLLDYRIIEESFKIPHKYKYHYFNKKYILKELTYEYVPKELLDRPKKGFEVPLRKWLRTWLKEDIKRYADPVKLKRQDIFLPEAVKGLIEKQDKFDKTVYSTLLWSFYVFQLWYQRYVEDLWE